MPPESSSPFPNVPTQSATIPAPTVVSSQPAEDAINGAMGNVANYNANLPTPNPGNPNPSSTTTPAPSPTPTTTPNNEGAGAPQYGAYTDPKSGQTDYYALGADGQPIPGSQPVDPATVLNSQIGAVQIPTPPAQQTGYNDPYTPGANVDANGNIVGTNVPAAVALGTTEDVNDLNTRLLQTNDQINQSGQDSINLLSSLMNGTIPMTPAQTSLIANMTTQMQNLISLQTSANQSYIGSATEAEARSGEERYSPTNAAAMINTAVFTANTRLSAIASDQAIAIAQVTEAAQKDDYDAMLSANENYQDTLKQQQATLENLSSQVQQSIVDARNANQTIIQNQFSNNIASATLSMQQKNYLFQNYISSQNLSLAQKTEAETIWKDQQDVALQRLQVGISAEQENIAAETFEATFGTGALGTLASGNPNGAQGTLAGGGSGSSGGTVPPALNADGTAPAAGYKYNSATGQFTDGSGKPITGDALSVLKSNLNTAGVHTYDDGLAFLDTSGYSNQDMATGAQNAARANGILPLAPADASIVNNLEAAKSQLANLQKYFNQVGAPSSFLTTPFVETQQAASLAMGNSQGQAISEYNSAKASLYDILSSLSESKRANGGEFEVGSVSIPVVTPGIDEGGFHASATIAANGNAQFTALNAQLNSLIASIVPGFVPQTTPSQMSATDVASALAGNTQSTDNGASSQPLTGASFFNAATTPTQ